jgi:hypothetical protein
VNSGGHVLRLKTPSARQRPGIQSKRCKITRYSLLFAPP